MRILSLALCLALPLAHLAVPRLASAGRPGTQTTLEKRPGKPTKGKTVYSSEGNYSGVAHLQDALRELEANGLEPTEIKIKKYQSGTSATAPDFRFVLKGSAAPKRPGRVRLTTTHFSQADLPLDKHEQIATARNSEFVKIVIRALGAGVTDSSTRADITVKHRERQWSDPFGTDIKVTRELDLRSGPAAR